MIWDDIDLEKGLVCTTAMTQSFHKVDDFIEELPNLLLICVLCIFGDPNSTPT